jgi:RNA polymerase sigma-70 factor, ECF subfamily
MSEGAAERVRERVEAAYRSDSRRVLATLIRLLGDFDLAEEALHKAFTAAVEQWPRDGVPANPRAWLVSAGPLQGHRRHPPARPVRRVADGTRRARCLL